MGGIFFRTLITVAAVAVAAPVAVAVAASPGPVSNTAIKVGPKQDFRGFVNAKNSKAVIRMACPLSSTGHPLAHQTVRVALVIDPFSLSDGSTGTKATSIGVWLTWPTTVKPSPPAYIATFSSYGSMPIPTSITLPCQGSGQMLFLPAPGSGTVKAATVSLTFINIAK